MIAAPQITEEIGMKDKKHLETDLPCGKEFFAYTKDAWANKHRGFDCVLSENQ